MATHRTMLFDHCVITFAVEDHAECRLEANSRAAVSLSRRRALSRAAAAGCLLLLLATLLLSLIGAILFAGFSEDARQSQDARYVHAVSASVDL